MLLEHVAGVDSEPSRPSAHERLERVLGKGLTRLLVGALAGGRRGRATRL